MQSPWSFWTQHSSRYNVRENQPPARFPQFFLFSLFFEDDLMEVGSRVKLNNQAAMAMGSKLMLLRCARGGGEMSLRFLLTPPVTRRRTARSKPIFVCWPRDSLTALSCPTPRRP